MRIIDEMLCLKCNLTDEEKSCTDLSKYEKVRYWLVGLNLHASVTVEGDNLITYDTHRTWTLNKQAEQTVIYPYGAILYDFDKGDFILASTYDFDMESGVFTNDDEVEFELCKDAAVAGAARCELRKILPYIGSVNMPVSAYEQFYILANTIYYKHYLIIKTGGVYFRINIHDLPSIAYPGLTIHCTGGFGIEYEARITECSEDRLQLDIDGIQAEIGTNLSNQPVNVSVGRIEYVTETVDILQVVV